MRLTREYVLLISNLLLQVSCKMLFFRRGNDELPRSARAASPGATAPYRSRRPDRHCAGARYRVPAGPYLEFPARAALAFPAGAGPRSGGAAFDGRRPDRGAAAAA